MNTAFQTLLLCGLVFGQIVSADEPASAPVAKDSWPLFRGNPSMTGVRTAGADSDLRLPLELVWTFQAEGKRVGCKSSAIIADGRVFIGDDNGVFHCLSLKDGTEIWKVETGDTFEGTACFAGDDLVVVGVGTGFVHAFERKTGKEVWKFETMGEVLGSMNVHRDPKDGTERIIFGSYDNFCYCLDAKTGEKLWEFETGNYINGAVAIDQGQAMFGGCDGFIYRVDVITGEAKGEIEVGNHIASTIAVDSGVAYTGHYGNRVSAFNLEDGAEIWEYGEREFPYFSSPLVLPEHIIIGGRDKRVHCIDRVTGKGIWEYRARDQIDSSPVLVNGVIYLGCDDGVIYGLGVKDGEELWTYELGEAIKSSPAVAENRLVISTDDGAVHCFRTEPAGE